MSHDDHFDIEAWVDFARGLSSPAQNSAMQIHLASGCVPCSEMASLFVRIWKISQAAAEDRVPENWSRQAEDILHDETIAPIRLLPVRRAVPAINSFAAAEGVSVRADSQSGRHVVYEAQGCVVTLKLDAARDSRELSIVGQIADRRGPGRAVGSIPVFLLRGTKLVATTSSNDFGEFQLAFELKHKMLISFPFDGSRIDVMLDQLPGEETH
jgi:hypothetical protein